MKTCTKCKNSKPLAAFYKRYEGKAYWCNLCIGKAKKDWASRNKERISFLQKQRRKNKPHLFTKVRRRATLKKYGLSIETFNSLLEAQNRGCKICGTNSSGGFANQWAVDHCHKTGETRGILCTNCNKGLGYFKDNISLIEQALAYLHNFHRPMEVVGS